MKKAILFGASGFIGAYVLDALLNHPAYEKVTIVVRKSLNRHHPKLTTLIGDYQSISNLKEAIAADEVFITLGTTKKNTPDKKAYYQVDHDYPVLAASLAKEKGAKSVLLVTAIGANAQSNIFYIKTKGEVERDIIALNFEHTYIFRPSMLMGSRKENRPFEKFFIGMWSVINPLLVGPMSKYKGITGKDVAQAIVNAANKQTGKLNIYHWKEMKALL